MSEVVRLAKEKLRATRYNELHRLSCREENGLLVLQGTVSSFHMKQLAQTTVMRVCESLRNDVVVDRQRKS